MGNKLFGTDGVRGVANTYPMTAQFAFDLAQAAGKLICSQKRKVAIGKDTRVSGDMLEAALVAGFTSQGVDVELLGVVPTPAVTFLTPSLNVDMSVMITASHNPYFDNGIKLIAADGNKFSDEVSSQLEAKVSEGDFSLDRDKIGICTRNEQAVSAYLNVLQEVSSDAKALNGLKVVIDCANGAFSKMAPQILKNFGAEVMVLAATPNGYNINADCGSQHTDCMARAVVEQGFDIGIAVDGDGDRIIVCDEKGNRLDGDQIIAFLGQYLHSENKLKGGALVATVWSNLGLEKHMKSLGVGYFRTAVGERYVVDKMKEIGANIGGEESGHMVLRDFVPSGDGLVAGLIVCLGLIKSGKKMSEIFPIFVKEPCLIKNIRFDDKAKITQAMDDEGVKSTIAQAQKDLEGQGSVIVRKSGTEPIIKIRVEGENEDLVAKNMEILSKIVSKFI